MKKLAVVAFMVVSLGASAEPFTAIGAGIVTASPFIAGLFVGDDLHKPIPACYSEPNRKVAWANNPKGYSFTVAGCDYQAKKDLLVEVK